MLLGTIEDSDFMKSRRTPLLQILLQKSFCASDQNFFWLHTRLSCKDAGDPSPEDKLAGDLGHVIEATSTRKSSVGIFFGRQISSGQFGTLQQYLHRVALVITALEGRPGLRQMESLTRA